MEFSLNTTYNRFIEGDLVFSYKGSINSQLVTEFLEIIEKKLTEENLSPKTLKKLYNVLVEALQNLFHHAEAVDEMIEPSPNEKFILFSITSNGANYILRTGNFIKNENIHFVKDRIEQLNSLSIDEVKSII
jgi:glucose-6-phosphate-specific signal transduction histidine kinase